MGEWSSCSLHLVQRHRKQTPHNGTPELGNKHHTQRTAVAGQEPSLAKHGPGESFHTYTHIHLVSLPPEESGTLKPKEELHRNFDIAFVRLTGAQFFTTQ